MTEEKQIIGTDGLVKGTISKDEVAIHYQIEGRVFESAKLNGIDVLAEVRAAILTELDGYAAPANNEPATNSE